MAEIEIKPASMDFAGVNPPSGADARQAQLAKQFDSTQSTTPAPSTGGEISESEFEDPSYVQSTKPSEQKTDDDVPEEVDDKSTIKEEVVFEKPVKKEEVAPTTENPPFRPAKRDYTKFDPDDVPQLKKLTNFQFATVEKFAQQKAELKSQLSKLNEDVVKLKAGNLPDSWQEHPQAYTLTKEYQDLSNQLTYDNFEEEHWTDQLRNIKAGKDWYDIKGYDEKSGQPVYELRKAQEGQVDFNAEIMVGKYLNNVGANKANRFAQINRIAGAHQQYHNQAIQSLKEAENKFFPSWSDSVKIPPEVKRNMDLVTNATHPAFRNHPSTPLLAKSYAYIQQLIGHIKQLTEEKKLAEDKIQDRIKAGPSNRSFAGTGATNGASKIIDEKFFEG